jgi:hypothetical protein
MPRVSQLFALLALLFLTAPEGALAADSRNLLAVLELRSKLDASERPSFDAAFFTDRLRGEVLDSGAGVTVMTRENLLSLLSAQGKQLADCEGGCEVETGRLLGADFVVSGELLKLGATYKLSLRLHDTRAGTLLGTATASGTSAETLDAEVGAAVRKLSAALPAGGAGVPRAGRDPGAAREPLTGPVAGGVALEKSPIPIDRVRLSVDAPPSGAWQLAGPDGRLLCQLPCAADIVRGALHRAQKQGGPSTAEADRIDLPDSSHLPVGAATAATFRPARGNRLAGVLIGIAGGVMTFAGIGLLIDKAAGATPTSSASALAFPLVLFMAGGVAMAGGGGYALWSQPERFEYQR